MPPTIDVLVVGSLNHDIIVGVTASPGPGETVLAHSLTRANGGKGGNQAVAAARAGAGVRLVSCVGTDAEGDMQVHDLAASGVDITGIARLAKLATSLALIWVTPDGENRIIVTPGAKDEVTPAVLATRTADLASANVVLAQSETGAAVAEAAAELARQWGARFVFSCGPVISVSPETMRLCDPIIVNASEARELLSDSRTVPDDGLAQALLDATGAVSVVVTLGARGSVLAQGGQCLAIDAAPARQVIDTTGAGDTYCGVAAAHLALGATLESACQQASVAAAQAVGWLGARPH